MSDSAFLTRAEVERITLKRRYAAQCRVLDAKGIRYIRAGINGKGEPLVRRDDLEAKAKQRGPRWDRIGGIRQLRT